MHIMYRYRYYVEEIVIGNNTDLMYHYILCPVILGPNRLDLIPEATMFRMN